MSRGRTEGEGEEGGLSGGDLLLSCYRAMSAARAGAGELPDEWDDLDADVQAVFAAAVNGICADLFIAEQAGVEISASGLALKAARGFNRDCGGEDESFSPDARTKVIFEALVRHVLNCLEFDPDDHGDIGSHESAWKDWAAARVGVS